MNWFRNIVTVILILAQIACSKDEDQTTLVDHSFNNRTSILSIEAESGILKYTCDNDTALLYVLTHNDELPDLIINDQKRVEEIIYELVPFDDSSSRVDNEGLNCDVWRNNLSQFFDIQVSVSGEIKESFDDDSFLGMYAPFVASDLTLKNECEVQYQAIEDSFSLIDDSWKVMDVIVENDTISPTCEYNQLGFRIYTEDEKLIMDINTGVSTCYYEVAVDNEILTILHEEVCLLGIPIGTKNMWDFNSALFDVFFASDLGSDTIGHVSYNIEHNILVLSNNETSSSIRLFAN